nr:S8 family serine peptidase [Leifsonia psychrotolerans]
MNQPWTRSQRGEHPARTSFTHTGRSVAALLTIAAVAAATVLGGAAATAAPAPAGSLGGVISPPVTGFEAGRYIVQLADAAVATYDGGVTGFAPTQPDVGERLNAQSKNAQSYSDFLTERQEQVAAEVGADIDYSYTLAINAFAAELSTRQAVELSALKGVIALTRDELKHVTAVPSVDFLGLTGYDGVWAGIGGPQAAGNGIVVGVLDTGIAPENPSFTGKPLGTTAGSDPYLNGTTITFAKSDGGTFTGECVTGEQFTAAACNTKLIGARYYVSGFGLDQIGDASVGEYVSPRDGDGHGSHTASTAVGNHDVAASVAGRDFGLISGVAPAAKVAAYKVCWSGPDAASADDDGCATSDMLAAIDQSVADGVDVLNFSIGGGSATTTVSPTDIAFLGAASAGIFVAAAAGNSGPDASTLDNASPWITTVAASTIPSYEATATLGNGMAYAGASITVDITPGVPPLTGPLARADLLAAPAAVDALLCAPGSLDPTLTAGKIVFCQRGVYDRVAKSAEVKRAGGIGMLLVNKTPGSIDTDDHSVPTVHLDSMYWDATFAYAAEPGATVTFTPGNSTSYEPPTPQVAGFSSRGPVLADGSDILKPDIAAPGVAILADGANAEGAPPTFQFLSGTSMASPHIAGLAALYLGERPNASPAEVKSAMMTTAYDTVDGSGELVTDPFAQGAGHVDPTRYFEPGLLYLNGPDDWWSFIAGIGYDVGVPPIDPSNLNLASIAVGALTAPETITRTVTATRAGDFSAQVTGLPGIDVAVVPSTLSFGAAGESASYAVTFSRTDAALDAFSTGSIDWFGDGTRVHSPVAVQPVTLVAPQSVAGTGTRGSVDVSVTAGASGDIPLGAVGLAPGVRQPNAADPADPHSGSGASGDQFSYQVEVPAGTELARFDLNSVDDTADLDLTVYLLDGDGGQPVAGWQSATSSADERVDLPTPDAGFYLMLVEVFSGSTAFDMTTFAVPATGGVGSFAVAPNPLPAVQGVPISYTASWSGLAPETDYLGLVHYGDTGLSTAVGVASGPAQAPLNTVAPSITGTAKVGMRLTAQPGEWDTAGLSFSYQWQRDGVNIRHSTGRYYTVMKKDRGHSLGVVVTAKKAGVPTATAASARVMVKYGSKLDLDLRSHTVTTSDRVRVRVELDSSGRVSGQAITVTVTSASSGPATFTVTLDRRGQGELRLPRLSAGSYTVQASFAGTATVASSVSAVQKLTVKKPKPHGHSAAPTIR